MVLLLSSRRLREDSPRFRGLTNVHSFPQIASEILRRAVIYDGRVFTPLSSDCRVLKFAAVLVFSYISERVLFFYLGMVLRAILRREYSRRDPIPCTSCPKSIRYARTVSLLRILQRSVVFAARDTSNYSYDKSRDCKILKDPTRT